jgi:hypothetical protein
MKKTTQIYALIVGLAIVLLAFALIVGWATGWVR